MIIDLTKQGILCNIAVHLNIYYFQINRRHEEIHSIPQ